MHFATGNFQVLEPPAKRVLKRGSVAFVISHLTLRFGAMKESADKKPNNHHGTRTDNVVPEK